MLSVICNKKYFLRDSLQNMKSFFEKVKLPPTYMIDVWRTCGVEDMTVFEDIITSRESRRIRGLKPISQNADMQV